MDLIRIGSAASVLAAATQAISGQLLKLKLSDPSLSIVAQLSALEEARPFLGGKLTLLNSQGIPRERVATPRLRFEDGTVANC